MFRHHYNTVAVRYMTQHCIHTDKNLLLYVKDLISRYKYQRGYDSDGLLWEQKAVEVVGCINAASYKVRATVELAKHCHSPWSKCIADLVDSSCLLHHEDVQELESIKKRSMLSHLLASYDIPKEVVPTPTNVMTILKYILKCSAASLSGVSHALQVGEVLQVEAQTVYLLACQSRLMRGEDIADILEAMPADIARQVKTRIVSQCVELFNQPAGLDWAMKSHWADTAIVILSRQCEHVDGRYFHVSLNQLCFQLKALLLLKKEFNVEMTLTALDTKEKITHLLQLVNSVVPTSSGRDVDLAVWAVQSISNSIWSLETFSSLCSISKRELYQSIYQVTRETTPQATVGVLELIVKRDKTSEAIKFVKEKVVELIERSECGVMNSRQLLGIAQTCITYCDVDDLTQLSTILNALHYHHHLMLNCLGADEQQDMTSLQADKADLDNLFTRKYHSETDLMVNTSLVSDLTNQWMRLVLALCSGREDNTSKCIEVYERCEQMLRSNNHDLLCIRMSIHLYFSSAALPSTDTSTQLTNYLSSRLKTSLSTLIPKLLSHRNLDVHLILSALLDMPPSVSLSLARKSTASYGSQFLRILSLANVALVICEGYKQSDYREKCIKLRQETIWGHILTKYGVKYLSVFGKPNKEEILEQMACKCPVEIIDCYISDFSLNCDTERTYLARVNSLIEKHCQTVFWSDSKEGAGILDEIASLLTGVNCTEELIDSLVDACNPYNYSLMQTLVSASSQCNTKKQQLLNLLTLYKREVVPSTWETNHWRDTYADKEDNSLPQIAHSRLPYQPLLAGNVWKVLCPELSSRTFQVLQPIVSLLEIKTDVYLLNTALQIVESHIGKPSYKTTTDPAWSANWSTDDVIDSKFVDDIMEVLAAIQDKRSAVMCSQSLIERLPNGTEKVLVSKICVDLTRNWKQSSQQGSDEYKSADAVLRKITTEHCRLSVEQSLYQHALGTEHFVDLIAHPIQLIQAILETTHVDSSVRAKEKFAACCCIAELTGRDIGKVCFDIINDEWLSVGSDGAQASIDMDMTMTLDMAAMLSAPACHQSTNEISDNIDDQEKWIVHLANSSIGLNVVHLLNSILLRVSSPTRTKLLVIRCLLLLGDSSSACYSTDDWPIQLTNEQLTREYKALQYIDRLHSLNINMTVEEYYGCNMNSLMVRLRKNYANNPLAIDLCIDLCLEAGNYEIPMWRSLLQQMIQLNMVEKLSQTLTSTADQTQLWTLEVYKQAWQLIASKSPGNPGYKTVLSSCPVLPWIQL